MHWRHSSQVARTRSKVLIPALALIDMFLHLFVEWVVFAV
jgi:hypothetical protein